MICLVIIIKKLTKYLFKMKKWLNFVPENKTCFYFIT